MKTTKTVVMLECGNYVADWQYSQGHFDVAQTNDPLKACEVDEQNFMVFFMDKGATLVTLNISVAIKPMSGAALEVLKMKMVCARQKQEEEGKKFGKNKAIYDYLD